MPTATQLQERANLHAMVAVTSAIKSLDTGAYLIEHVGIEPAIARQIAKAREELVTAQNQLFALTNK